jgi:uncharacterized protein
MENENITAIFLDDTFRFSCGKDTPCFNECCRNINQFITPYDVLRLKKCLNMKSGEFLEKYTTENIGPDTGLPIISLKLDYENDLKCPFVTKDGCSVYEDRPSSCRTYPVIRLAARNRITGNITEQFALIKEEHCKGFENGAPHILRDWLKTQKINIYNEMNDMMLELISIKKMHLSESLSLSEKRMFSMACYDLDAFRDYIFENDFPDNMKFEASILDKIKKDDTELLKFSMNWLKTTLLGQK